MTPQLFWAFKVILYFVGDKPKHRCSRYVFDLGLGRRRLKLIYHAQIRIMNLLGYILSFFIFLRRDPGLDSAIQKYIKLSYTANQDHDTFLLVGLCRKLRNLMSDKFSTCVKCE